LPRLAASPVAREFAVTAIRVGDQLRFHLTVTLSHSFEDGEEVILPIDGILHYVIDRHFSDEEGRKALHERMDEGNVPKIWNRV
jgi:hypothetical protein